VAIYLLSLAETTGIDLQNQIKAKMAKTQRAFTGAWSSAALMAHELPASQELPDRQPVLAACLDISQTYQRSGFGQAMAKFTAM
jgi:hypothetical protein